MVSLFFLAYELRTLGFFFKIFKWLKKSQKKNNISEHMKSCKMQMSVFKDRVTSGLHTSTAPLNNATESGSLQSWKHCYLALYRKRLLTRALKDSDKGYIPKRSSWDGWMV